MERDGLVLCDVPTGDDGYLFAIFWLDDIEEVQAAAQRLDLEVEICWFVPYVMGGGDNIEVEKPQSGFINYFIMALFHKQGSSETGFVLFLTWIFLEWFGLQLKQTAQYPL